jgi:hypothetical protein
MTINLEETLQRAEILYYQFKQRVGAVDDKKHSLEESLKSGSSDQDKQTQDDLSKLPAISEPLRDILQTTPFTTNHSSEKE